MALWPAGEPDATPEWIRANVDNILAALERSLRRDGHDVRRLPRQLHWVVWLLADIEPSELLDG